MTNTPAPLSQTIPARRDDSPFAVALVVIALLLVTAAVFFLWSQIAPQPPFQVEKYLPLPNGAAFTYRVTNADGTVSYRSRNIYRARANAIIAALDSASFAALLDAAKIDVEKIGAEQALPLLNALEYVEIRTVEYNAAGAQLNQSRTLALLYPDRVEAFAIDETAITPPIPLFINAPTKQTTTGTLNETVPYTATFQLQPPQPYNSALGEMQDCVRVEQTLDVNNVLSSGFTYYCAGVGEVYDETTDANGTQRAELVAASVENFLRGSAPVVPASDVSSQAVMISLRALPIPLRKEFEYKERSESRAITTNIMAVENLLLYGTESGALVALDRAAEQEVWRFQTDDAIYSTPVVVNGVAYFGSADKKVYAVRAADGAFVWAFQTNDIVTASPAVDQASVYVGSQDGNVYALDADTGRVRWSFDAKSPILAQPVVQQDVVYVSNDDGGLYALHAVTGNPKWAFAADSAIIAPVTLADGIVYVTVLSKEVAAPNLYALNQNDGSEIWKEDLGDWIQHQALVANGRVYVIQPNEVFAVDVASGEAVWRYESEVEVRSAPLLFGNQLWLLRSGDVIALDANTGALLSRTETRDSGLSAGLSSNGRELYAGYFDGVILGLGGVAP